MRARDEAEARLEAWMADHGVPGRMRRFAASCHTAAEAAAAAGVAVHDIVKNVCLITEDGRLVVAVARGDHRVSTRRVGRALGLARPRPAGPDEVLRLTGYPAGGVPSFGYEALFLVDEAVMERPRVLTGGGSDRALVEIAPADLVAACGARIARIRK
ncbi:aminoacyl-tRNA deacylase [Inmirania thermothiophila]|uniref:Prolyl-tRNA editing enzyme YbaK/EbsC (Cys-tRNA(Pro) deacylase) n=1 Tax=Inmirania thermothiophila TaxID=1750597 RepID=A0A3N1YBW7_9GAMM|nr:YbaK/EbsC family protein [Inmirania thermothiophila]ROR34877.1 prolyl-tRNA editing enzyme YbaK/EbsC (Cys-tRNA(Pro) deacylase) [Inmirania thermothiophila]